MKSLVSEICVKQICVKLAVGVLFSMRKLPLKVTMIFKNFLSFYSNSWYIAYGSYHVGFETYQDFFHTVEKTFSGNTVCFDFGENRMIFLEKKQKMAFIWCWFMKPLVANVVCKARIENDYMLLICTKKPSNCSRKRQCSTVSIHQRQLPKIERVI